MADGSSVSWSRRVFGVQRGQREGRWRRSMARGGRVLGVRTGSLRRRDGGGRERSGREMAGGRP